MRALARSVLSLLAAVLTVAAPANAENPRDQQWQYFATNGSGQPIPTAIFLSWDYSQVLFIATCPPETRTLRLRHPAYWPLVTTYNADDLRPRYPVALPMALARGAARAVAVTHLENSEFDLVGEFALNEALLALLAPAGEDELAIEVENETGDPWFAGSAEPLYRLARQCADAG